tara:strand:+ start:117 stop:773 length:657 start_codon:yes stop_codon:yes gene_type:complete
MSLTQGHQIICCDRNRRGGLKRIWLSEVGIAPSTEVTYAAGGEITSFSTPYYGESGRGWYEFQFDRGTAGFTANATRENGSTLVTVELEFYIPKITEEINARLRELTESCGIYVIVESFADDCDVDDPETYFFLLGYDKVFEKKAYMEFSSGEQSTGVALQDANGTAVKLSGVGAEYPREILVILNYTGAPIIPSVGYVDMYQPAATGQSIIDPWQTD